MKSECLMDYRKVGNSGVQVSCICLGAAFRGFTNGRTDEQTSRKTIERAVDLGINFIDCANFYFVGKCEELLGKECPVLRGADENSCCPDGPRLDSVIPRGRRPAGATAIVPGAQAEADEETCAADIAGKVRRPSVAAPGRHYWHGSFASM